MAKQKFVHIVLQTAQKAKMVEWYNQLLGAHVVFENELLSFITYDDEHHRLAFLQAPLQKRVPGASGMNHSAFAFDSLKDLLERYTELEAIGIEPAQPIQHGVTTSLYYRDPDGNFVELQADNFKTPAEATAYMQGPEYGADAVGVGFSPELMKQALEAGTPETELMTRAWALKATPGLPDPIIVLSS